MENRRLAVTYYPRHLTKQASHFCVHDLLLDTYKTFTEASALGHGDHGYVRLFTYHNEKMAVKGLMKDGKKTVPLADCAGEKKDAINELKFLRRASSQSDLCTLHHFVEGEGYSFRMTFPFIEGENIDDFATRHIKRTKDLALLILRILQAVQALHATKTVHGDFGSKNTLVRANHDDFIVKLIDFGLAYSINGYATAGFERAPKDASFEYDIAEERYAKGKVRAHPSQDVFSIGKVLNTLLGKMGREHTKAISEHYPSIERFIMQAETNVIADRPDLNTIIAELEEQLDWTKKLSTHTQALIKALESPETSSEAVKLLESKSAKFKLSDLELLVQTLIENQKFQCAFQLLSLKKRLQLANCQKAIITHLHEQDYQGNTITHAAAQSGDRAILFALLHYNPDVTIKNFSGETVVDCAHESVKPVLQLCAYIKKIEATGSRLTNVFKMFTGERNPLLVTAKLILGMAINQESSTTVKVSTITDKELRGIIKDLIAADIIPAIDKSKNKVKLR